MSFSIISLRNSFDSTRTGRKKSGRLAIHRDRSIEMPPPGTIMCTSGLRFPCDLNRCDAAPAVQRVARKRHDLECHLRVLVLCQGQMSGQPPRQRLTGYASRSRNARIARCPAELERLGWTEGRNSGMIIVMRPLSRKNGASARPATPR
jgi:hypothetical protein